MSHKIILAMVVGLIVCGGAFAAEMSWTEGDLTGVGGHNPSADTVEAQVGTYCLKAERVGGTSNLYLTFDTPMDLTDPDATISFMAKMNCPGDAYAATSIRLVDDSDGTYRMYYLNFVNAITTRTSPWATYSIKASDITGVYNGMSSLANITTIGFITEVNAFHATEPTELFIDNLSITVPEPMTVMLLAAGGVSALIRRRK